MRISRCKYISLSKWLVLEKINDVGYRVVVYGRKPD